MDKYNDVINMYCVNMYSRFYCCRNYKCISKLPVNEYPIYSGKETYVSFGNKPKKHTLCFYYYYILLLWFELYRLRSITVRLYLPKSTTVRTHSYPTLDLYILPQYYITILVTMVTPDMEIVFLKLLIFG